MAPWRPIGFSVNCSQLSPVLRQLWREKKLRKNFDLVYCIDVCVEVLFHLPAEQFHNDCNENQFKNSRILSRISNYPNALAVKFRQYESYFCLFDPCLLRLMMTVLGPTFLNPDYILLSLLVCGASFETSTIDIFPFPYKNNSIYYCPSFLL